MNETVIPAWEPHGKALLAYWNGNKKAKIAIYMDDGEHVLMPAKIYFRSPEDSPELEKIALEFCEGRVLDVGAGAGAHSLILEEMEFDVVAIDIDPIGADIMKKRGLSTVVCADFLNYKSKIKFDTLLFLMNGIGLAGTLDGLCSYLKHAYEITSKSGQIILDSSDLRISNPELNSKSNYFGEVNYQLSFEEEKGSKYQWLYIDPEKLEEQALLCNWNCEIVYEVEDLSLIHI